MTPNLLKCIWLDNTYTRYTLSHQEQFDINLKQNVECHFRIA